MGKTDCAQNLLFDSYSITPTNPGFFNTFSTMYTTCMNKLGYLTLVTNYVGLIISNPKGLHSTYGTISLGVDNTKFFKYV